MRRVDLEHIIGAAGDLLNEKTVIIVGSQAILASFAETNLPSRAVLSPDVDVLPLRDPVG
jgi:hypothetical protein